MGVKQYIYASKPVSSIDKAGVLLQGSCVEGKASWQSKVARLVCKSCSQCPLPSEEDGRLDLVGLNPPLFGKDSLRGTELTMVESLGSSMGLSRSVSCGVSRTSWHPNGDLAKEGAGPQVLSWGENSPGVVSSCSRSRRS